MQTIKTQTKLVQWGNSKATRIPAQVVSKLNLSDNQHLEIEVKDNSIILTPSQEFPSNIHELFANWEDDGQRSHELDWGSSKGEEVW